MWLRSARVNQLPLAELWIRFQNIFAYSGDGREWMTKAEATAQVHPQQLPLVRKVESVLSGLKLLPNAMVTVLSIWGSFSAARVASSRPTLPR